MSLIRPKKSKKGVMITAAAVGTAVAAGAALLTSKKGKALLADASKEAKKVSKSVRSGVTSLLRSEKKQVKRTVRKIAPAVKRTAKLVRERAGKRV
jgi:hypothetical protein